jgi:anti-sigma factor RsiW
MEHETVAANRTVERYILGELDADERDSFEEHYFECADCGDEVRTASAFLANLRAVMAQEEVSAEAPVPRTKRPVLYWLRPAWGLGLAGVLMIFASYQAVVIRSLSTVRQVNPFVLLPETRGDARVVEYREGHPLLFSFEIPTGVASAFQAEIVRADTNATIERAPVKPPAEELDPAHVLFPKPNLGPGRYVLVLRALDGPHQGEQIDRYPFDIKSN